MASGGPAKLKEAQTLFDPEAKANRVYPRIDWSDVFRSFEKFREEVRNRK